MLCQPTTPRRRPPSPVTCSNTVGRPGVSSPRGCPRPLWLREGHCDSQREEVSVPGRWPQGRGHTQLLPQTTRQCQLCESLARGTQTSPHAALPTTVSRKCVCSHSGLQRPQVCTQGMSRCHGGHPDYRTGLGWGVCWHPTWHACVFTGIPKKPAAGVALGLGTVGHREGKEPSRSVPQPVLRVLRWWALPELLSHFPCREAASQLICFMSETLGPSSTPHLGPRSTSRGGPQTGLGGCLSRDRGAPLLLSFYHTLPQPFRLCPPLLV